MAGNIDKKRNELVGELETAPATHVGARSEILSSIALSREFEPLFLGQYVNNSEVIRLQRYVKSLQDKEQYVMEQVVYLLRNLIFLLCQEQGL